MTPPTQRERVHLGASTVALGDEQNDAAYHQKIAASKRLVVSVRS
jgi:hypothetical protein